MILHNLIYYLQFLPRVLFFLPCILSLFCPSLFHVCFLFISFAFIPSSFYSSLLSPCVVPFFLRFIILSLQFLVFAGFTLKSCHSRNTCCKFIVKFNVSCLEKEPKILKSLGGFLHERCICLMLSRVHVSVVCVVCCVCPHASLGRLHSCITFHLSSLLDRVSAASSFSRAGPGAVPRSQQLMGLRKVLYRALRSAFRASRRATCHMLKAYPLPETNQDLHDVSCCKTSWSFQLVLCHCCCLNWIRLINVFIHTIN